MVGNIVSKPLGLVLFITAHMVLNGPGRAELTGILGRNITFPFTFNVSLTKMFAVYIANDTKIAGYTQGRSSSREGDFYIYPENTSVFCHITNLKQNHSGIYWASLFTDSGLTIKSNNKVQLIVQEENSLSAVPTMVRDITTIDGGSPTFFSSHTVTVLVVTPVALLAALLPFLVWHLVRSKDNPLPPPQQGSNLTVQETVEASNNAPPLVYSVLDFPKRPSAVLEMNPSDTEYAAVNYLSEKRQV